VSVPFDCVPLITVLQLPVKFSVVPPVVVVLESDPLRDTATAAPTPAAAPPAMPAIAAVDKPAPAPAPAPPAAAPDPPAPEPPDDADCPAA